MDDHIGIPPVENTGNIFMKALVKSGSCSLVLKINFIQKISFFTLSSQYFPLMFYACMILLSVFIVYFMSTLACEFSFIYNLL